MVYGIMMYYTSRLHKKFFLFEYSVRINLIEGCIYSDNIELWHSL